MSKFDTGDARGGLPNFPQRSVRPLGRGSEATDRFGKDSERQDPSSNLQVALVTDWLVTVGGAERVLLELHKMYPEAPIYTSKYNKKGIDWFEDADVRTGYLQHFPNCLRRFLSPLRMRYFSRLDLTAYDLVISVTGAEAKAVKTKEQGKTEQKSRNRTKNPPDFSTGRGKTTHVCYCHVPTQYYWGLYDDYLKNPGFGILNPLARLGLKLFVKPMRKKDFAAAKKPDYFVTISDYAKQEIERYYSREATVIYPPVDTKTFISEKSSHVENNQATKVGKSQTKENHESLEKSNSPQTQTLPAGFEHKNYFITTSRQVSWKRLDLAIKACQKTHTKLILIGDGPERKSLEKLANKTPDDVVFLPEMSQGNLKFYLEHAAAYLFPSKEPFGIAPVEALAAGCPVIALNAGGAKDYLKDGENGLFFGRQTEKSLAETIERFKNLGPDYFPAEKIKNSALPFDTSEFVKKMKGFIHEKIG